MSTAISRQAQYNREYRERVKAEKKKVVHQATEDEMVAMKELWMRTNKVTKLSDDASKYAQPSPMIINTGVGGRLV